MSTEAWVDPSGNLKSVGVDEKSVIDEVFSVDGDVQNVGDDAFFIAWQCEKRRA